MSLGDGKAELHQSSALRAGRIGAQRLNRALRCARTYGGITPVRGLLLPFDIPHRCPVDIDLNNFRFDQDLTLGTQNPSLNLMRASLWPIQ